MTAPSEDDFARFVAAHASGSVVNGRVVKVVPFGVFVEMAAGIHGLLPGEKTQEGTEVRVRILDIDPDRQRMSLTLA
jgi:small subunit ribosomal protein S1